MPAFCTSRSREHVAGVGSLKTWSRVLTIL